MGEQRGEEGAGPRGAGEQPGVMEEVRGEQGREQGAGSRRPEGGEARPRGPGEGGRGRGARGGAGAGGDIAPGRQEVGGVPAQRLLPLAPLGPSVLEPDLKRKIHELMGSKEMTV